ncbi:MAG: hypothetical protein CK424_06895 [Legionella sp.]|nr:MAG: hypothetical protein CK424_06895 [Legionella sp.]
MAINDDWLKQKATQKIYEEKLEALRRNAAKDVANMLSKQAQDEETHASQYDQFRENFIRISDDRRQQVGSESFPILLMQMGPSLVAFAKMAHEYKMMKLNQLMHFISENINTRDFSPLAGGADLIRKAQLSLEHMIEAPELPPVFVPYLAEIDDNGILSVDVSLPDFKMTAQDIQDSNDFKTAVQNTITHWINNEVDSAGQPLYRLETVPDQGQKIRILSRDPAAQPRYMSKMEFRALRDAVVEPQLKATFDMDFQHDAPSNYGPR